jgi:hypothetical protein
LFSRLELPYRRLQLDPSLVFFFRAFSLCGSASLFSRLLLFNAFLFSGLLLFNAFLFGGNSRPNGSASEIRSTPR